jgi:hypothetical protein
MLQQRRQGQRVLLEVCKAKGWQFGRVVILAVGVMGVHAVVLVVAVAAAAVVLLGSRGGIES